MYSRDTSNSADIIDSRNVIDRIQELESERGILQDAVDESPDDTGYKQDLADWNGDYADELHNLKTLAEEAGQYSSEWPDGVCLIRDTYFAEYAEEEAFSIGAIDRDVNWPFNHIDWEAAAKELKQDYSCFDYDGEDYWVRST